MRLRTAVVALGLALASAAPGAAFAQQPPPAQQGPKLTKPPKLVKFVEAPYPEAEAKNPHPVSVVVEISLSDKGAVTEVTVVTSGGTVFDAAAVAAVKQFVFEPAEIDDKPSPVKLTYRYDFVVKEVKTGPVVNFEGILKDRSTKKPVAGATITVDGDTKATTDENGHFQFTDLKAGKHTILVEGPGITTVSTEETIEEQKHLEVKYSVEPSSKPGEEAEEFEVLVVVPKIKKEAVSTTIQPDEGRRVPGTQGDTLKVVQNMPGVARASFGSGALVVWGAAAEDTRVYVDGVAIPRLYHGGGLRSVVNSDMVESLDLVPGGYGAAYGRGIGGLVTITTREPRKDGIHGYVAADVIDASGMIQAPLGDATRVSVAVRKSYLDQTLRAFTSKDVGDLVPIPDYLDGQVKIVRDLGANETLEAFALGSTDSIKRTVTDVDPTQTKSETTKLRFGRVIVKYQKSFQDGSAVTFTPSVGKNFDSLAQTFGATPASQDQDATVLALRADWRGRVSELATARIGVDVEGELSTLNRSGSVTSPPREGDIHTFGQPPPDRVNADQWSTTIVGVAPFATLDVAPFGDRLHIDPGLRVEPYVIAGSRLTPVKGDTPSIGFAREETAFEPRLSVRFDATKWLSLRAAWGIYHQAPRAADLSAVFGNPNLGLAHANHGLVGATFKMSETLSLETVGFVSISEGLVARSESPTPRLAQALIDEENGRAYGGQILLRKNLANGFFGWASYSLIRSERRDHPDTQYRLFDSDQTHVATFVASYQPGHGFEVGARVRLASGFPRTPVVGAFYDTRRDLYEPYFGAQNSARLPFFFQADLRAAEKIQLGKSASLEVYLDVQNVTNQKNAEEVVYRYDYKEKSYITGLPILPVLGARLEF